MLGIRFSPIFFQSRIIFCNFEKIENLLEGIVIVGGPRWYRVDFPSTFKKVLISFSEKKRFIQDFKFNLK